MKLWIIMVVIMMGSIGLVAAENTCAICNETCSPCGGGCTATDLSHMFYQKTDFNNTIGNITAWNTTCVTDMHNMFERASDFNQNISGWNTANVVTFGNMFNRASVFNQEIGKWNTSKVNSMGYMFYLASDFNGNISGWDTSKVTDFEYMFYVDTAFNQDISHWNTSKATDMSWMFDSCVNFNQPIGSWDTGRVTNMQNMFGDAESFNQSLANWNTESVTDMSIMFANAFRATYAFNQDITTWNTSNVANMSRMFYRSFSFNQPIGVWDTHNVKKMKEMFINAYAFNQNISGWNVSGAVDMSQMFYNASSFNQDLSSWDTGNVTAMANIFYGANLSVSTYSRILDGWAAKTQQNAVVFGAGSLIYYPNASSARSTLINVYNWTLTDGGQYCSANSSCDPCLYCTGSNTCSYQYFTDFKSDCGAAETCNGFGSCVSTLTVKTEGLYHCSNFSDASIRQNNLTNNGMVVQEGCVVGSCFNSTWAGTSSALDTSFVHNITDNFTITMWVNPQDNAGVCRDGAYPLTIHDGDEGHYLVHFRIVSNCKMYFESADGTSSASLISSEALTPGTWYMLTGRYNGSKVSFYINGTLQGESNVNLAYDTDYNSFYLGYFTGGSNSWNGLIDEVAVYSIAKSSEDIASVYNDVMYPPILYPDIKLIFSGIIGIKLVMTHGLLRLG